MALNLRSQGRSSHRSSRRRQLQLASEYRFSSPKFAREPTRMPMRLTLRFPAALCVCISMGCTPAPSASRFPLPPSRALEFVNGRWFDGARFVDRTMYSVDGYFSANRPARVDSVIDLRQGYVVPPFGEAHNHNIDAPNAAAARTIVDKYLRDGVFYAQNPANVLRARAGLTGFINVPTGIDVTFSNAVLTGPGGHPLGLFFRNLSRGGMFPTDSNSTEGF